MICSIRTMYKTRGEFWFRLLCIPLLHEPIPSAKMTNQVLIEWHQQVGDKHREY